MNITGQLVLMDKGLVVPNENHHAVMIFGILAFPKDMAEHFCRDMQQRTFTGGGDPAIPSLSLHGLEELTPIPHELRGGTPSTLLTSHIWRV